MAQNEIFFREKVKVTDYFFFARPTKSCTQAKLIIKDEIICNRVVNQLIYTKKTATAVFLIEYY